MRNFSKLMLSDEEQQLVNNPGWILTKRIIINKVDQILGLLSESQKQIIEHEKDWLPPAVVQSTPKIAKGENYLQLPYLLLDYPRCFNGEHIFAVRTMFWWGNFFSITLQLSGAFKEKFEKKIMADIRSVKQELYICIHQSQWHHHFGGDNYVPVKQLSVQAFNEIVLMKPFIKLAMKFPLHPWHDVPVLLDHSFNEIIAMLKD